MDGTDDEFDDCVVYDYDCSSCAADGVLPLEH